MSAMILFNFLGKFFFGGREEPRYIPSEEDYEAARAYDDFTREGGGHEDEWELGADLGTIPNTPSEYEGEDTAPDQKAVRDAPWWRPFRPW